VESVQISILLSILSAVATAIWTVWTWGEQQNIDREQKRERLAASYINPFLLATEALQYRLRDLLYEESALRKSNLSRADSGFLSSLTLETLYRFALYFGWENYLFRYSPYNNDPRSIELSRKVVASLIDIENFPDLAFQFTLSEQLSLGQLVVKPVHSFDGEFLSSVQAIDLYRFEEKLRNSQENNSPLFQSPGVRSAIAALEKFSDGGPLDGRKRLETVLVTLVELLEYLEKEEGFSVAVQNRLSLSGASLQHSPEQAIAVVHKTAGRIRLRVPRTKFDDNYADRLCDRVLSLAGVTAASVNRTSASLIVHYTAFPSRQTPEVFLVNFIRDTDREERETLDN
jgi:Heavy metal associated domain 2